MMTLAVIQKNLYTDLFSTEHFQFDNETDRDGFFTIRSRSEHIYTISFLSRCPMSFFFICPISELAGNLSTRGAGQFFFFS